MLGNFRTGEADEYVTTYVNRGGHGHMQGFSVWGGMHGTMVSLRLEDVFGKELRGRIVW